MSALKELANQIKRLPSELRTPEFWRYARTTHFWGPLANWGFVVAGLYNMTEPAERLSIPMTSALCIYSALFMRFAWVVQPRNMLLFGCHFSNEGVQLYQLGRVLNYSYSNDERGSES